MKSSQTLIATEKEAPKDAELISHQYMLRSGLIRKLASGIYIWMPNGLRVIRKVEQIVREEMNKSGASELLLPSVLPAELLQETHRWEKFGPELLKLKDRNERDFCYGPTHEEPIVDMARKEIKSYKQLPLNLYQIQTKFRDEIRPRFGVMRAREFIMKDAYSFHANYECLQKTYDVMYQTYSNILNRMGLEFRAVQADAGAIGGNITHEFQVLANAGEDIVCYSDTSDYAANIELASYLIPDLAGRSMGQAPLEKFATPNITTIAQLCNAFNINDTQTVKTLIMKDAEDKLVAFILRGDHELNEIKANKVSGITGPLNMATDQEIENAMGAKAGSLGPINCPIKVVVDYTAAMMTDFSCGANETGYHYRGANWDRDIEEYTIADIRNVTVGDITPDGKGKFLMRNGIEVGHIFQLGTTYSEAMKATVLDENGKAQPMVMGCYGFGVSRILAATIEQSHDEKGIIWPQEIAPFKAIIIPMNMHKTPEVAEAANRIYQSLLSAGVDVLLDDRKERPGIMFADADLIGAPHQIIIGARSLEEGMVEHKCRKSQEKTLISTDEIVKFILQN